MGSTMDGGRLPDFVIVGAARAGTTALWTYLRAHPGVYLPYRKELNFFNYVEPSSDAVARYCGNFAGALQTQRVGEASPLYLFSEDAARRMAATIPGASLVVTLRDPVARAYSHYWWRRLWRAEDRSFQQAVDDELRGHALPGAEYLAFGRYREQLDRFTECFPREALLINLLEDWKQDAEKAFERLCRHVGVDASVRPDVVGSRVNTTADVRSLRLWRATRWLQQRLDREVAALRVLRQLNSYAFVPPPIDRTLEADLRAHFAPFNAELSTWLGRDLHEWSPPAG